MAMIFASAHDWLQSHHINPEPYSFFVAYLAASVLIGVATSKLVDFSVLRLRDRYVPRLGPSALQPSGGDLCHLEDARLLQERPDPVHGLGEVLVRVSDAES